MLFTADDGVHGRELWITDGTSGGTMLVKDVRTGTSDALVYSSYDNASIVDNKLVFIATDNEKFQLWMSDGTEANTKKIFNDDNISFGLLGELNGLPYYMAYANSTSQIIRITASGVTEKVKGGCRIILQACNCIHRTHLLQMVKCFSRRISRLLAQSFG
ncbi:MAG: hypothetical protein WDO15_25685 [Bacteroidota bacterium]